MALVDPPPKDEAARPERVAFYPNQLRDSAPVSLNFS
jgi:hypothetical protein